MTPCSSSRTRRKWLSTSMVMGLQTRYPLGLGVLRWSSYGSSPWQGNFRSSLSARVTLQMKARRISSKQTAFPVGSCTQVEFGAFLESGFRSPPCPLVVHQYGLFKFSTGNNSRPSTPTATMRSRAAIFGLDVIGRNLFGQGINIRSDLFSSVSSRTKSSRSSVYTDGSLARFSRSNSTATAATTISEGESSLSRSRSTKPGSTKQKLIKRKSPAPINPGDELPPPSHSRTRAEPSRARSVDPDPTDDDEEYLCKIPAPDFDKSGISEDSEWDLTQNLELARRNSKSQGQPITRQRSFLEEPIEETIYEGR